MLPDNQHRFRMILQIVGHPESFRIAGHPEIISIFKIGYLEPFQIGHLEHFQINHLGLIWIMKITNKNNIRSPNH